MESCIGCGGCVGKKQMFAISCQNTVMETNLTCLNQLKAIK